MTTAELLQKLNYFQIRTLGAQLQKMLNDQGVFASSVMSAVSCKLHSVCLEYSPLCAWILDFLIARAQIVRVGKQIYKY